MAILNSIVRLALRLRGVVIALACLFLGYGLYVLNRASYDVFPEFTPPQVGINTEASGLSPEQVEMLVTQPIENAVNGAPGIESIRSQSLQGISTITVTFDPKSDIYRARQIVAERLTSVAGQLPQGVQTPAITPLLSSTGDLMVVGLTSSSRSLMDLRTAADWTVRPHLLAVPGVADVPIYGGDVKQLQIQLLPEKLIRYGLSVEDVVTAAQKATGIQGAGVIDTPNQRIVIETQGQITQPELLARTVVRWRDGEAVTLGDVGRVLAALATPISGGSVNGEPAVIVKVSVQYGANTLDVSRRTESALEELRAPLKAQGIELHADLFRAAGFVEVATRNVRSSLLLGAALVVVVLFLFLFNLRTAVISCTAIPLSLLASVVLLEKLGYSLNTMTLGGLAIAIGEVVDDAVIDVENILRRLIENRKSAQPLSPFKVVLAASIEVRSAVIFATFAVTLVFVPIMTLSGLAGRMFAPLGIAYILAILISLVVALTLTPAMCLALLRPEALREKEAPIAAFLRRRYERLLHAVELHWTAVMIAVTVLTLGGLATLPLVRTSFLPALKESHFLLHMTMTPGISMDASVRQGQALGKALLTVPEIRLVSAQVGRASTEDVRGPQETEFGIDLKSGADTDEAETHIREVTAAYPGAAYEINSFLTERVNETLSGYTAPVAINLFGNDLEQLDQIAKRVSDVLAHVHGSADIQLASPEGNPQLVVHLRPEELLRRGLTPVEAMDAVRIAYEGNSVGQIHEGTQSTDVVVILDPATRQRPASIGELPLRNQSGRYVLLKQVADIYEGTGRYVVQHEGARRVQTITCNVTGRSVSDFVGEARTAIERNIKLPPGTVVEFAGSAAAEAQARSDLLLHSAAAAIGIVLLLLVVLGHWKNLSLILVNLPFALVGGLLAALLFGGEISLGSMVGFVTVFGITLRNSIMLLSHYEHLVRVEGRAWTLETAILGARERLVPILMTALVTALGLLPLALGRNAPGREIEGPMALVIFGGLTTSTLLNLLVLPTLALRFARFQSRGEEAN